MSDGDGPQYGPFHYTGTEGFEAWGYRFPSGFTIMEWIADSVPEDAEQVKGGHASTYLTWDDFRTLCSGNVEWGRHAGEVDADE